MRQRQQQRLPNRATVEEWVEDDDDGGDNGDEDPFPESSTSTTESSGGYQPVHEDVACRFEDESTEFVRSDSGERVKTPARVLFPGKLDIESDQRVTLADGRQFEIRGVRRAQDDRRGRVLKTVAALEAA